MAGCEKFGIVPVSREKFSVSCEKCGVDERSTQTLQDD
jgi:hypothetical protein